MHDLYEFNKESVVKEVYTVIWDKTRQRDLSKDFIEGFIVASFPNDNNGDPFYRMISKMINFAFQEYNGICHKKLKIRNFEESFSLLLKNIKLF